MPGSQGGVAMLHPLSRGAHCNKLTPKALLGPVLLGTDRPTEFPAHGFF
jgi:hypothetical protein